MKTTKIALLGVLVAGLVGAGLASASLATPLFLGSQASYMENSSVGMMGHITAIAYDADGNIKSYIQSDNSIMNVGENCVTEILFNIASGGSQPCAGTGPSAGGHGAARGGFTFLAIGTNNAAVVVSQTALSTEAAEARINATTASAVTVTADSDGAPTTKSTVTLVATFTSGSGQTIEEYGLFDAASSGNMFARQTPGGTILASSDTLQVTWTIDVGS